MNKTTILEYFEADEIQKYSKSYTFKKGEIILRPYNDTKYVYAIKEGLVKVYGTGSENEENIAVIYGPGYLFPVAWILNNKRPAVYFQAITDTKIHLIEQNFFEEQIKQRTDLSFDFINIVLKQLALFAATVHSFGFKEGRERLAYRLLVFAAMFGEVNGNSILLPPIKHSDIGATVNLSRETVSREMTKMDKEGIIEYSRTGIAIKDIDQLSNLVSDNRPVILFDNF